MKRWPIVLLLALTHVIAYKLGDFYGFKDTVGADTTYGRFLSRPKTEWLEDRKMRMLEDFVYIDPRENAWLAPRGSTVDGASIPQAFWTFIGSPFTGKYRNASIVHDVACVRKDKPHRDVHRMFFDACLAGGVPEAEAKRLYYAVARYGPRWATKVQKEVLHGAGPDDPPRTIDRIVTVPLQTALPSKADLEWAKRYFEEHNPTIAEIEELADVDRVNK